MPAFVITKALRNELFEHLGSQNAPELVSSYLFFLEKLLDLAPVVFPKEKMIYQSADHVVKALAAEGKLWHETEILVRYGKEDVNDETSKIYICPFTGKVFGDNTCVNPQDAIYDWVSKCPENKERVGGLPVKRFLVSEDPGIIRSYITADLKTVMKKVYSSVISGKLYSSKEAVIAAFKKDYLKDMSLEDVQSQNRFTLEESFLSLLQKYLNEEKITAFVEALAEYDEFTPYVTQWTEGESEEE